MNDEDGTLSVIGPFLSAGLAERYAELQDYDDGVQTQVTPLEKPEPVKR